MAKQFEIYWFDYVNQDGTKKTRPILVLESNILLPIAEITSHKKRTNKDYKIIKWKEAGLPKKSIIRFDKIQFATNNLLQSKIGDLQQEDIDKIRELKLIESLKEELRKTNASKLFKLLNAEVNKLYTILSLSTDGREIIDKDAYDKAKQEVENGIKIKGRWFNPDTKKSEPQPNSYILQCNESKAKELANALIQQEFITIEFKDENTFVSSLYRYENNDYKNIETSNEVVFNDEAKKLSYYSIINGVAFSLGLYGNNFNLDENKDYRKKVENKQNSSYNKKVDYFKQENLRVKRR